MLSRAVAGVRGDTLIINLPGSEKAVRESLAFMLPVLEHAVETVKGLVGDHASAPAAPARG
jgi:molybdopterin biosynthesis enzyme MoaB